MSTLIIPSPTTSRLSSSLQHPRSTGIAMRAAIRDAITVLTVRYDRPPTNREIGRYLGGKSTGHIDYHLRIMVAEGMIDRHVTHSARKYLTVDISAHDGCSSCSALRATVSALQSRIAELESRAAESA